MIESGGDGPSLMYDAANPKEKTKILVINTIRMTILSE